MPPRTPERFNGIFQGLTEIVPFDGERRAIYRTDYWKMFRSNRPDSLCEYTIKIAQMARMLHEREVRQ
ncbi:MULTISPECIES: hypothetical protein [unclassified Paraburkholderia]|uniref:hypothetical protein n=1 Tax=unclassified Paraburkholderia TaxID=2615204 RepID=UPI001614E763|nr:hypothetical protein [Paraburkholderia sp. WSM4177]MBB5483534.1 hypothetical protein [Paraburkholderia sp. WSM4180]